MSDGAGAKSNHDQHAGRHEYQSKSGGLVAFKIIFTFTRTSHLLLLVPALMLAGVAGTFKPVMAIITGRFLNSFSQFAAGTIDGQHLTQDTSSAIHALIAVGAATWLVRGVFCCAWITYGESQARAVREDLFSNLVLRDLEWFDEQSSGVSTLLSRAQAQIRDLQLGVSQPLGFTIISLVQSIVSIGIAFYYSWKLTLVLLATFPIIAFALSTMSKGLQQFVENQQAELTNATKQATHVLNNIMFLKCHNTQASEAQRYAHILEKVMTNFHKQALRTAYQTGFMRIAGSGSLALALFFGTYLIHNAHTMPGEILTTFWCCITASSSLNEILAQVLILEKSRAAAVALRGLLAKVKRGKRLKLHDCGFMPSTMDGDVEFRDVTFSYPSRPDQDILRNVNLFLPAHETTFVVGKSGSGKSTLSTLLLKLYSASSGRIEVDGHNLRKLDTHWLRNNVTLVQQNTILFDETIVDNVTICDNHTTHPSMTRIRECLDFAELSDTIAELPCGLDTKVGRAGGKLSGGQKQRIALARARLRDTPILILDESTSALDNLAKTRIMNNIRRWRKEKTTIIITHDLSHIESGDFVYVLKDGCVMAEGYRSAVEATLEQTSNYDLIGNPPVPLGDGIPQSAMVENRAMRHGLRLKPMRLRSTASVSSIDSAISESSMGERATLLTTTDSFDARQHYRRSLRYLLKGQSSVAKKHEQLDSRMTDAELDAEYELSKTTRPRRLPNRFTAAQTMRPFSMHPAVAIRPMYQPQGNALSASDAHRVTGWDDSACDKTETKASDAVADLEAVQSLSFLQILFTVWHALKASEKPWLVVAFITATVYAAIPSISAWVMVHLFQNFHLQVGWVQNARRWSMILVAVGICDGLAAFTIHFLFEVLSEAWINALRRQALRKILSQPLSWFDREQFSCTHTCSTLDTAAEETRDLLSRFVSFVWIAIVMMIVSIIWSMINCWKLTLVVLGCAPIVFAVNKVFDIVSSHWEARTTDAAGVVANMFAESFSDVRTVRALTLESRFHQKHALATAQAFAIGKKRGVCMGLCYGASDSCIPFVTACLFTYGISLAKVGETSPQAILTVLSMMLFSLVGASAILGLIPRMSAGVNAANRLLRLIEMSTTSCGQEGDIELERKSFAGNIEFSRLSFSYSARTDAPILKDLSFTLRAGTCTAIVGRSGSGKSTILSLILGLRSPDQCQPNRASLTISSQDIRRFKVDNLRSFIAYVPQQAGLFPMTIRENICYGLPTEAMSEGILHSAAHSAGIHDFVVSLPSGYDTVVGDGGLGVSGGQAQRIVLARAFARRPKILLLDEPTSALDVESSEIIYACLQRLKDQEVDPPTIVIVTHTRELMEIADEVVVLEAGSVAEQGDFKSLMRQKGRLWQLLNVND